MINLFLTHAVLYFLLIVFICNQLCFGSWHAYSLATFRFFVPQERFCVAAPYFSCNVIQWFSWVFSNASWHITIHFVVPYIVLHLTTLGWLVRFTSWNTLNKWITLYFKCTARKTEKRKKRQRRRLRELQKCEITGKLRENREGCVGTCFFAGVPVGSNPQ